MHYRCYFVILWLSFHFYANFKSIVKNYYDIDDNSDDGVLGRVKSLSASLSTHRRHHFTTRERKLWLQNCKNGTHHTRYSSLNPISLLLFYNNIPYLMKN